MKPRWPDFVASTFKAFVSVRRGEDISFIHRDEGEYYGITWDESSVYLAHKKNLPGCVGPQITVFDRDLNICGVVPGTYVDVHQILYRRGELYITNTECNRVDIYDGVAVRSVNWTEFDTGVNHINSLFFAGTALWSCHHNLVSRGNHTYSELVRLSPDLKYVARRIRVGRDLHNVFVGYGKVYTLSSLDEELLEVSLATGVVLRRTHIGMWPRGFAATDKYFLVGVSTKIDRSNRPDGRSEVHLVDRQTLKVVDSMRIDGVGVMHDIRVTSEPDYAHNGIPFPGEV